MAIKEYRKDARLVLRQKHPIRHCRNYRSMSMKKKIGLSRMIMAKGHRKDTRRFLRLNRPSRSRKNLDLAMLRYLGRAGGQINSTGPEGDTALHLAVEYNDFEAASQFIRRGADVNSKNNKGETPLLLAVLKLKYCDILKMIPNGMRYGNRKFYVLKFLRKIVTRRAQDRLNGVISHRLVKMLLDAGATVNTKDSNLCSPLQFAIYAGDEALVKTLIDAGASVNDQNGVYGVPPLHDAVLCCNETMVDLLLSRGANVAAKDKYFRSTALHWASILNHGNSHDGLIRKLLELGGELNEKDLILNTPFELILETGDVSLVKLCIDEYGADLRKIFAFGNKALSFAARNANKNVINLVLDESEIEIEHKCHRGHTPLHLASELSMPENVRQLISKGADVNAEGVLGYTPLALCILGLDWDDKYWMFHPIPVALDRANFAEEKRQVIRLLLEYGSDVNQKFVDDEDQDDQPTILQLARDEDDTVALNAIIEHVALVEARTNKPLLDDYNLKLLDEERNVKGHYQMCQAELTAMKNSKVEGTTITYFSVLTEPLDVVARYAKNEDFVKTFETGLYQIAYPIYASLLREKFKDATHRQKMMKQACAVLSSTLRFVNPTNIVIEMILSHLSVTDIELLIGS